MFKRVKALGAVALGSLLLTSMSANAATEIEIQSVLSNKADEIVMLRDFADTVEKLTEGEVTFKILPNNAVVPGAEIMNAVDKGLLDGGFAWTHYLSLIHI